MTTLSTQRTGLALGSFLAVVHLAWSTLVAVGWAQPVLNYIMKIHMVQEPVTVLPFDFMHAVTLVIVTGIVGFVLGYMFAATWNKMGNL